MQNFHPKQFTLFDKMKNGGSLAHAFLFTGPGGVGKYAFAKDIAFFLQDIERGDKHPDIIETPSPLPIKEAKELKKQLKTSPYSGKYKIVIINKAENMHTDAANSLLKMIEEPKGDTIFILVSSFPELILQTIRSRCYEVKFSFVPDTEIENGLEISKIKELRPHWTGRPSTAKRLLNDSEYCRKIEEYKKDCSTFLSGSLQDRFQISEKYAKINKDQDESFNMSRERQGEIIRVWIEHIKDKNIENKEELIKYLLKIYKNVITTNANFNYLFNSFAINTFSNNK